MSWNPLDTVRDVRDFAYQNTGADNFMNIARGVNNGTINYGFSNLGDKNSLWGNLGAGLGEAGLMFTPGGGALKAGKLARQVAGKGIIKGMPTSFGAIAKASPFLNPIGYGKNLASGIAQNGLSGALKRAAIVGPGLAAFGAVEPYAMNGLSTLLGLNTPASAAERFPTSTNRSGSPAGTYNTTGVSPTMATTTQTTTDPYLGGNGVSNSYLDPATASSFNTTSGLYDSQFKTGSDKIQSDLLSTIQGIGRTTTGGTMDAMSQAADEGGWANSPQVETLGDYINQRGSQATSQARLASANSLADLQMQTAQAKDANARAKAAAEWQARMDLFQRALASQPGIGVK